MAGRATQRGTTKYAESHRCSYSTFRGLRLSKVGLGTSLGTEDARGGRYSCTASLAFGLGINVVDTAISYGGESSERGVGAGLRTVVERGIARRDELFVVGKCGYLPDGRAGRTPDFADVFMGGHCMAPAFIADQIQRSRTNLGLRTIDLYLVHNPEVQAKSLTKKEFERRLAAAFEALEQACADGLIGLYGISTWEAFRVGAQAPGHLDLLRLRRLAREVCPAGDHFAAVEAPFNMLWREIATRRSQGGRSTLLKVADGEDMLVLTSSTLAGGALAQPDAVFGGPRYARTSAQRSIAFALETDAIGSALVGMKRSSHVREAADLLSRRAKLLAAERRDA